MKRALALALLAAACASQAWAQAYPTRVVRMLVGYPAGGSIDTVGRIMAQAFSESMGQSFIVENRPGASATIATSAVVKARRMVTRCSSERRLRFPARRA